METQTLYHSAIKFAAEKHMDQKVPGTDISYVVHLSNVAMEVIFASFNTDSFNLQLAIQIALLHDILEDTSTDFAELESKFGVEIANAVSALTKDNNLPKEQQMEDSLARIKEMTSEVWAVKLADRITNLQAPPLHWSNEKKITYREEAQTILRELKGGNQFLERRLGMKIEEYQKYLNY